jgi:hypothetical protein
MARISGRISTDAVTVATPPASHGLGHRWPISSTHEGIVVHDGAVVVRDTKRHRVLLNVELAHVVLVHHVEIDGDVTVPVWPRLLVVRSQCVHQLVDRSAKLGRKYILPL